MFSKNFRKAPLRQGLFILCCVLLSACSDWVVSDTDNALKGTVISVADGDTVTVLDAQKQSHKIRLAFIDAPERSQSYGQKARQALAEKVYRHEVLVDVYEIDRYGREVGRIRVDNRDINLSLVSEGYAWHYRYYAEQGQDRRSFSEYEAAQKLARQEKRGLWRDENPIPPWEFRRNARR